MQHQRIRKEPAHYPEAEAVFLVSWIIYIVVIHIGQTVLCTPNGFLSLALKAIRYGNYLLFLLAIVLHGRFKRFSWLSFAVLVAGSGLVALFSNMSVFIDALVVMAATEVSSSRLIRATTVVKGILIGATIILAMSGLIDNHLFDSGTRNRATLGFGWVTTAPILYLFVVFQLLSLKKNNYSLLVYLALSAICTFLYIKTKTRMACAICAVYIFVCFMERFAFRNEWLLLSKFPQWLCLLPFLIAALSITFYASFSPQSNMWNQLNGFFSNRMLYCFNALRNYGIKLFGQSIEWIGHSVYQDAQQLAISDDFVDCSYLRLLLQDGIFGLTLHLLLLSVGMFKASINKNYALVCAYCFMLFFFITDGFLDSITCVPFTILAVTDFDFVDRKKSNKILFNKGTVDN